MPNPVGLAHIESGINPDNGDIIAHVMTGQDMGDSSQVGPLLDQIDGPIGKFIADGAHDDDPTYDAVTKHSAGAAVVISPRANAIDRSDTGIDSQCDRHIAAINTDGRMKWQTATGYGKRSLVRGCDRRLQVDHRTPAASTLIPRATDRSCYRRRRPQPNAGMCMAEVRPVQDSNGIDITSKSRIHPSRERCTKAPHCHLSNSLKCWPHEN
ncbi:transposase [Rhizobium johnstonii]|uniref:transposase n=1 Tax=Rhizobium johnstonii TaxID=3019933 RepID=UPI003F9BC201